MGWNYITQQGEVEALLPRLMEKPSWGVDIEATGLDPLKDKVLTLQVGRPEEQFIIDVRKTSLEPLRPFFETTAVKKIGHAFKYDYKMLKANTGLEMENVRCTFLAEQTLNKGRKRSGFGLGPILQARLGAELDKGLQTSFVGHEGDFTKDQLEYMAKDVEYLLPLSMQQCQEMIADGVAPTWLIECDALQAFGDMELGGMLLDREHWTQLIKTNQAKAEALRQQMNEFARQYAAVNLFDEVDINYDSPPQMLALLKKMRIVVTETDFKTGKFYQREIDKTDDKTLKKVKDSPFIQLLKEYRGVQIRINTFGFPFIDAIHPVSGRIHPLLMQYGTETGRPTAAKDSPVNPLNLPREKAFRNGFISRDGYVIETDDYSGCELRILAEASRDPGLVEAFCKGIDVHCYVASRLFNCEVTKKNENSHLRTPTKPLNFGIAYGMGPRSLYERINAEGYPITFDDTVKLYRTYCDVEFKTAVDWLRACGRQAVEQGYLANMNGRRRYWLVPNYRDREIFPRGEYDPKYTGAIAKIINEGGNMMIQSVNQDMGKVALAELRRYIKRNGVRSQFMNYVYDEIVTETHKDDSPDFVVAKRKIMIESAERWLKVVPMEVDGHVGPCWTK